jgi:isopentenyldiphosphate isomerase
MKQQIQIVDDSDNLIAHKARADVDPAKDIYRVAALWLTNSSGDVLIAQRKFTKESNPGKWGPAVAGTVDEGETYEINIYKEAEEEIGLTGVTFQIGPKLRAYEPRNHFTQWYTAQVDRAADSFVIQEEEVEAVKWISQAELIRDVGVNPDRYITSMGETMEILTKGTEKL